jgi:hypothetical protein
MKNEEECYKNFYMFQKSPFFILFTRSNAVKEKEKYFVYYLLYFQTPYPIMKKAIIAANLPSF